MTEPNTEILPQIIAGILSGGAGAATSLLGVFRKTKARLGELEESVGQEEPVKTGLFLTISAVEDTVKRIKREIESWEDSPPKWAERLLARARTSSSSDLSASVQFEDRIERSLRSFNERLSRIEDDLEKVRREATRTSEEKLVTREEFVRDSRARADEAQKLREQLATVNGLLRGVMSALGIIGGDDSLKPPKLPNRPR